jgi:hypothetical protein
MSDPDAAAIQRGSHEIGDLLVWTICESPKDYPGRFTARPHSARSSKPLAFVLVADSLDAIRALLPPGLACLMRNPNDDPVIVETWL